MSLDVTKAGRDFIESLGRFCGFSERFIVKFDESTSEKFGWIPYLRPIDKYIRYGVINLDKPPGPTSHEVVAWVKKLLGLSKAGHGGTLDPRVTGVLPIALENVTKIIGLVMHSSKEYICVMQLHKPVLYDYFIRVVREFTGVIYQKPPLRSSVKRSIRRRTIYSIDVLEFNGRFALLRVECDAGTYMRKLCWDIGLVLGVGAHMRELRRTRTGVFSENTNLVRLQDLSEAVYRFKFEGSDDLLRKVTMPGEFLVCSLPKIILRDTAVESIVHGAKLAAPGVALVSDKVKRGDTVALLSLKGELVAIGRALMDSNSIVEASKGIVVEPLRVVMEPGLYPKAWRRGEQSSS
ncbi:MAG: RNA-guided pseudouridylation complex pseudouridine synthase subunit Cbf5 [Acidilobaceae archaeon]